MRLMRLDLARYGHFTGRRIDFGPAQPGVPDLHIVFGPNEAGKSTLATAWLDLLFGIVNRPNQPRYDFLHPGAMRIGAEVQADGRTLTIARISGKTGTLRDAADAPLPETVAEALRGGLGREEYGAMFALDDRTIEAGGEDILASKGDLGQLLFAAGAGLGDLGARLALLRTRVEEVHRPGARSGPLHAAVLAIRRMEDDRRTIDTEARAYHALVEARDAAMAVWRRADDDRKAAAAAQFAQARLVAALPAADRLRRAASGLAALGPVPVLPPDIARRLDELSERAATATALASAARDRAGDIAAKLADLRPDRAILEQSAAMDAAALLLSEFESGSADLPRRRQEMAEVEATMAGLLHRLGQAGADAESIALTAAARADLRRAESAWSGIDARLVAAQASQVARARDLVALPGPAGTAVMPPALPGLLASLRARDPASALREARAARDGAEVALARRMRALAPWAGDAAALAALAAPTEGRIAACATNLDAARVAEGKAVAALSQAAAAAARAAQAVTAGQQPDAADPAATRALREHLWARHRALLDDGSADAFEAAMRADDLAGAAMAARQADAAAQAQRAALALAAERDRVEAEAVLAGARTACAGARAAMAALPAALSLPADLSASDLRGWLAARSEALAALDARDLALRTFSGAEADLAVASQALAQLLTDAARPPASDTPYDALLAAALALAEGSAAAVARAEARARAVRLAEEAATELASAAAARDEWQRALVQACAGTWLADRAPQAGDLAAILPDLDLLDRAIADRAGLVGRIGKMDENVARFDAAVQAVALTLGEVPAPPAALWRRLAERRRAAEDARQAQVALAAELAREQGHLARQEGAAGTATAGIAALCAAAGVADADGLRTLIDTAAQRQALCGMLAEAEAELARTFPGEGAAAVALRLQGADPDVAAAEAAALAAQTEVLVSAAQAAFGTLQDARGALAAIGGDDAAARLEERRAVALLDLEELARAHLRLRLGLLAVDRAMRVFRETHRSAMMAGAARAFAAITCGAYTGLATHPEGDREVLVATAAGGASKRAVEMSKGTRFQLYLALRVAGYQVLAQSRQTVPFLADDILETFDDGRAAATLGVLAEMAGHGQVIYLTHHAHLVDIAERVVPGVRVHRLA